MTCRRIGNKVCFSEPITNVLQLTRCRDKCPLHWMKCESLGRMPCWTRCILGHAWEKNVGYWLFGWQPLERYSNRQNVVESTGDFGVSFAFRYSTNRYIFARQFGLDFNSLHWWWFIYFFWKRDVSICWDRCLMLMMIGRSLMMAFSSFRGRHSGKAPAAVSNLLALILMWTSTSYSAFRKHS